MVGALKEIAGISGTFKANLIAWLADASNGIQDLFAKNLHAENIYADRGFFNTLTASSTITAGQELCVGLTCVTEGELQELLDLRSLLNGSVLGTSSQSAASTPAHGDEIEAPASLPAPGLPDADTASTSSSATSSPPAPEPTALPEAANNNEPSASTTPEAANDNAPVPDMQATGTDASSTAQ